MGHNDLLKLYPIYRHVTELEQKYNWGYKWNWDQGDFETAIQIEPDGIWHLPIKDSTGAILCPDIVDLRNKIIIEFEEEASQNTGYHGAKRHKGHFQELLTVRDQSRDSYYEKAGFKVFKIYESDQTWKPKLFKFLANNF